MKRVCLLMLVVVALASYAFAPHTSVLAFQEPTYGDCKMSTYKNLTEICGLYHAGAPGLVGTASCLGEDCFTEHEGYEVAVAADGKPGDFPATWLVKVKPQGGKLDVTTYTGDQCVLPDKGRDVGKGVHIGLSTTNPHRCKVERVVGEHLYHDHFASNSTTKCLAWIECREDNIPLTR